MHTKVNPASPFVSRLSFVEPSADRFALITMANDEDEVWLAASVMATRRVRLSAHDIAIELHRGEYFRDRVVYRAILGVEQSWRRVFRVQHSRNRSVSSRLIASLRVDGHEIASARLLLATACFDAQGRLVSVPVATQATRLAYANEFEQLLVRDENGGHAAHPF
ncbi:MAG: hypothetical protein O3C40_17420 [Planctomycetota bacterium]|nr:hypothetical protein [Planctomycetota bacterium]